MGTRGFMGYVVDGDVKATYVHYDAYPDGLGLAVGRFAASLPGTSRFAEYADKARAMVFVDEDVPPTEEQRAELAAYTDTGVSRGDDWYAVLRKTQGNLALTLDCGLMPDSTSFAYDSLFAEWGYLVNFDTGMVEVYRGFQTDAEAVRGRFAGGNGAAGQEHRSDKYSPVTLLGELPFALCASEMFWEQLSAAVYAHEEAEDAGALDFERLAVVVGQIETGVLPE